MSGEQASLPPPVATHEEERGPGQHEGHGEGREEPGRVEAVVRQNLRDERGRRVHPWSGSTPCELRFDQLTAKQGQGRRDAPGFAPGSAPCQRVS